MALFKNFGLTGIASLVGFGKGGNKFSADISGSNVSLLDNTETNLVNLEIRDAVEPQHAVQFSRLETLKNADTIGIDVNYNSGSGVPLLTPGRGIRVLKVVVEPQSEWTGFGAGTDIQVGDQDGGTASIYDTWDPEVQNISDYDYYVGTNVAIDVNVISGGATAGSAHVWMWYAFVGGLDGKFATTTLYQNDVDGGDVNTTTFAREYDGGTV